MSVTPNLDDLLRASMAAPVERIAQALRVLRGESPLAAEGVASFAAEPFLTLKDVAKQLGVDPCTLWRWGVPGHSLGGRRRFRLSEVSAYLQSDPFKRRAASLRAGRRLSATEAPKQPTPKTEKPRTKKGNVWQS